MKKLVVTTLLCIISAEYQEMKLISKLSKYFNFDHNVFLVHSSSDLNRFINNKEQQTPQTLFVYQTYDNITLNPIRSKNPFLIVVLETSNFNSNIDLLARVREIQRSKLYMKIGMFFAQRTSTDDLQNLFKWCWSSRLAYIFASFYSLTTGASLNVFTYSPFGNFTVLNVTEKPCDSYFISENSNFQQLKFIVGNNFTDMHPTIKVLWVLILRQMNASYVHYPILPAPRSELLPNGTVDIKPLTQVYDRPGISTFLYPISSATQQILVPKSLPYSHFSSFLRALVSDKIISYSMFIVVSIMLLLSIIRYVERNKFLIFQCIADVVNLLLHDNGYIKYQLLSHSEILLIIPLTIAGFIFVNVILSTLQSYLTRPFYQPQINTIEDIYSSDLNIFATSEYYANRLIDSLNNISKHDWSDRVTIVDYKIFRPQAMNFERISFLSVPGFYEPLLRAQKRLDIRGYQICLTVNPNPQLIAHIVNDAFPFTERLNDIILRVKSSGIHSKWIKDEHSGVVEYILQIYMESLRNKTFIDSDDSMPTFFMYVWSNWWYILYGWLASVILFFSEIIWKKFINFLQNRHFITK